MIVSWEHLSSKRPSKSLDVDVSVGRSVTTERDRFLWSIAYLRLHNNFRPTSLSIIGGLSTVTSSFSRHQTWGNTLLCVVIRLLEHTAFSKFLEI